MAHFIITAALTLGACLLIGLHLPAALAGAALSILITAVTLGVQSYQRHADDVITPTHIPA
ncbi:hypothetical protein GCM10008959_19850 [Deinococcus seoulensis]|uniref:Uncharacterized protein n=2 Tax=Deinococcus TaxID=1298 RepID=A0ABQ2RV06_9DEIO|nr:hypothetical protein [Deinococcus knuensis]GGR58128.1 hypothetical protein GCM10008959_19850 [Deinococcus seoulensis]GGS35453.1 hypothetical protein GCM10008961_28920 [Deinococcus knuensis]